ncbi:dethiobiotin synthase [Samsonia erythrinae]|uniref:ATP-dependent dethiobiotin synthetase BioD n=1 Tax=Samsonia erythrinae TaxID=160434 RepID=A0A4R3VQ92_9GAMM|nr:dethiobiotin synthase [Samsonia erythrinae]
MTGTDTEVGKTVASMALLQAAGQVGYRTAGYKPVASGCEMMVDGLRNSDALALQANSRVQLDYQAVNPVAFRTPTAPHIISAEEQRPILLSTLSAGLRALETQADWVLVEGAGGWFTPLSPQDTFADWVVLEQLPVILVVGIKLGCINHAMLTAHAIQHAGLRFGGWIANNVMPKGKWHQPYLQTLQQRLPAPMLGEIPYVSNPNQHDLGQYMMITRLRNEQNR